MSVKNNILNRFIKNLISKGKKFKSYKIISDSFRFIQKNSKKNHRQLLQLSVINLAPLFNIKIIKKKRNKSKEFPFFLVNKLRLSLSIKFIIDSIRSKQKLANKMIAKDIFLIMKNDTSLFLKKKMLVDRSFSQKKYANYRWF
jgi:ribosomal protein S7